MTTAPRSLENWARPKAAVEQASRLFALSWAATKQARRLLYGTGGAVALSWFVLVPPLHYLLALIIACCGCHRADVKDYIAPDEAARQALTTALDAWQSGKTPDQIGASQPAINAQDQQWKAGKKLASYEIIGPAAGDDKHRRYKVKLSMEGGAPQEVTYVVFGKDPLWVVSAESYQKMSGM